MQKYSELLISSVDSDTKAADLVPDGVKTADLKETLKKDGVPAHKIASFIPVYRGLKHGLSLKFPVEQLREVAPAILREIGQALGKDLPVTKEHFEAAIKGLDKDGKKALIESMNPEKAAKAEKKAQEKEEQDLADKAAAAEQKKFDRMTREEKVAYLAMQYLTQCAGLGFLPDAAAQLVTEMVKRQQTGKQTVQLKKVS